jgi:sRNA-binding regulator protein Hfq
MSDSLSRPKTPIVKKTPALKGHEAFLKALEAAGAVVNVALMTDPGAPPMKGTIKHFDKYTISLKVDHKDGTYQVFVIFKHAIESFWTNPIDQTKAA